MNDAQAIAIAAEAGRFALPDTATDAVRDRFRALSYLSDRVALLTNEERIAEILKQSADTKAENERLVKDWTAMHAEGVNLRTALFWIEGKARDAALSELEEMAGRARLGAAWKRKEKA